MAEKRYFRVKPLALSGRGNKVFRNGDIITDDQLFIDPTDPKNEKWFEEVDSDGNALNAETVCTAKEEVVEKEISAPSARNDEKEDPDKSVLDSVAAAEVEDEEAGNEVEVKAYGDITVAQLKDILADNPKYDSDMRKKALYELYKEQLGVK